MQRQDSLRPRDFAILLLFSLAVELFGATGMPLDGHDEPRVAGIAREMAIDADIVTPRLNGAPFLEYPALGYLPSAIGLRIAGRPSVFAARAPIALAGVAAVALIAWAGAALGGRRRGLAAGFLLQTSVGFLNQNRKLVVDPVLALFVTWSCAGFIVAWYRGSRAAAAGFWLGMAGGFLSKGLIGVGVPLVAASGFLALLQLGRWTGRYTGKVFRPIGWSWGPVLLIAPIAAWLLAVERSGPGLAYEVLRQSIFRFTSPDADHASRWSFYLNVLPQSTFPLVAIAAVDVWASRRRGSRAAPPLDAAFVFAAAWLGLTFLALSISSAKRVLYAGPLFPAGALLAAQSWERVRARCAIGVGWERAWIAAMALLASLYAWHDGHSVSREVQTRDVFAFVAAHRAGRPLALFNPSERLSGAAVFYTGETMPRILLTPGLAQLVMKAESTLLIGEVRPEQVLPEQPVPAARATLLRAFPFGDTNIVVWSIDRIASGASSNP